MDFYSQSVGLLVDSAGPWIESPVEKRRDSATVLRMCRLQHPGNLILSLLLRHTSGKDQVAAVAFGSAPRSSRSCTSSPFQVGASTFSPRLVR
jgi:hypothetical protein